MRNNIEKLRISSLEILCDAQNVLDDYSRAVPGEDEFNRTTIAIALRLNDVSRSYADLADEFGTLRYGEISALQKGIE